MAGKKSRKRQRAERGSTRKASAQNKNNGSVSVEEKKPKLDDGLEVQSDTRVQPLNLETPTVAGANNDFPDDLQSGESKYVPPFTRKSKKSLQRDRLSSVSPDVKSARPKRPWKGKRISKETQQSFADHQSPANQQTNDKVCAKDSPKMREEEKEEDISEALEEVMICTQENEDFIGFSAGQNTTDELAVTTKDVLSSSMVSTAQEETSNIVMLVIENLFEVMYKQIYQCNNSEITSEFEEPKASVDETDTHSIVNIDIQVTDGSKEIDVISEEALKPNIETALKPVILATAALKKIVTGKTASKNAKKCQAVASSESETPQQQQQRKQAATNNQQHTSAEGHVHSTQETTTSEGTLKENDTGINHADETLENDTKGDLSYSPPQNETKSTAKQQQNSETEYESDSHNYAVTSKGEICAESKNLATEGSPITNPEVKDVVSLNNAIISINEEVHDLGTTRIPMEKDLSSTDICCGNHVSEKEYHKQGASDDLLESHEDTGMVLKPNINTPMLENEVSSTVVSENCGEDANNMCQMDFDEDLDQMVPNNCETTTVMLQENPGVESFTRKPKRKENDSEDSAGVCSQQQCSPNVGKRDLDEQMDKIHIGETLTTKKMNESCHVQESPQLLKPSTVRASDVCVDQEPITHAQIKMDTTVTYVESKLDQTVEDEITENQTSKVEAGYPLFGFDGSIMEFDPSMDCTDSQLVNVQDSSYENLLPESHKHDARQLPSNSNVAGSTSSGCHCSVEVPSDKGMIKGLISELSGLNKFIMGAWKDLENQKKRRQARLKLGKMKKLK